MRLWKWLLESWLSSVVKAEAPKVAAKAAFISAGPLHILPRDLEYRTLAGTGWAQVGTVPAPVLQTSVASSVVRSAPPCKSSLLKNKRDLGDIITSSDLTIIHGLNLFAAFRKPSIIRHEHSTLFWIWLFSVIRSTVTRRRVAHWEDSGEHNCNYDQHKTCLLHKGFLSPRCLLHFSYRVACSLSHPSNCIFIETEESTIESLGTEEKPMNFTYLLCQDL